MSYKQVFYHTVSNMDFKGNLSVLTSRWIVPNKACLSARSTSIHLRSLPITERANAVRINLRLNLTACTCQCQKRKVSKQVLVNENDLLWDNFDIDCEGAKWQATQFRTIHWFWISVIHNSRTNSRTFCYTIFFFLPDEDPLLDTVV